MLGSETSNLNALNVILTIFMIFMVFFLPRRLSFIPIILTACFLSMGQVIIIMSLHFYLFRIVILFGWVRIILRKEILSIEFNSIDKVFILWVIANFVTYNLLWQDLQGLINRLGFAYDAIGLYFLFRANLRDFRDIDNSFKVLGVYIVIPIALGMLIEETTGGNIFSIFGEVRPITEIRDGRLRCEGPFGSAIIAGTFGATIIPFSLAIWAKGGRLRMLAVAGFVAGTVITVTSTSSGPALAYLAGIAGLMMWPFRRNMRIVRWGLVFGIVSLHLVMKAPVWFLISRIGDVTGGTAWHRSALIDAAIRHFDEWWLLGTKYTVHWMPTGLPNYPDMTDITNMYIRQGVDGGLITMILFIAIIVICFQVLGRARQAIKAKSIEVEITIWCLGVGLFAHVISFFGVSYYNQIIVIWYLLLAVISITFNVAENGKYAICGGLSALPG